MQLMLRNAWTELLVLIECYRGLAIGRRVGMRGQPQRRRFDFVIAGFPPEQGSSVDNDDTLTLGAHDVATELSSNALSELKADLRLWSSNILASSEGQAREKALCDLSRHARSIDHWKLALQSASMKAGSDGHRVKFGAESILHAFRASRLLRKASWQSEAFKRLIDVKWPGLFQDEELKSNFMSRSSAQRAGFTVDMALVLNEQEKNNLNNRRRDDLEIPAIYRFGWSDASPIKGA